MGRGRKTWEKCVKDDMKLLGLQSEWAKYSGICGGTSYIGQMSDPCLTWNKWTF